MKYTVRHTMTLAAKEEKAAKESVSCAQERGCKAERKVTTWKDTCSDHYSAIHKSRDLEPTGTPVSTVMGKEGVGRVHNGILLLSE